MISGPNSVVDFYFRSFCDSKVTGYVLGGDFNNSEFAVDRDPSTYASTNGLDTDVWPPSLGGNALFTVDLLNSRSIDTIFMRCNFAAFQVYIDNPAGTGYPVDDLIYADYSNTSPFVKIDLSALLGIPARTITKITIAVLGTIIPNQEKLLYDLQVTQKICGLPISAINDIGQDYVRIVTSNLFGGSIQLVINPTRPQFTASLELRALTDNYTPYDALKSQFLIDACLAHIYYSDQVSQMGPGAWYLVNDVINKKFVPTSQFIPGGVTGKMELREV